MDQLSHETGHIKSGDVRIFYRRFVPHAGRKNKMPALVVHGLSYFSYDWIQVAAALSQEREVVAIDLRGFGDSDWSPSRDYNLRTMSNDLNAVLNHFEWSQAALIGHSMGGRICLATAGWQPGRVGALACVDFAPDVAAEGRRQVALRIGNQPDTFDSVDAALDYHGHAGEPQGSPVRKRYESFLQSTGNGFVLKRDLHYRDTFRETLRTGTSRPIGVDLWAMVAGLDMPALFIRASTSDMFVPDTLAKLHDVNPKLQAIEIEGSHDLIGDNPAGLTRALTGFLAEY